MKFFNRKVKHAPVVIKQKKEEKTIPFSARMTKPSLMEGFESSIKHRAEDFVVEQVNIGGNLLNIATDSGLSKAVYDNIAKAYEPNIAGQEVIYTYFAKQSFIGFQNCAILSQNWLINKACMQPAVDASAISYDITLNDDETTEEDNRILEELKAKAIFTQNYDIISVCREFAEKKRRFGQCLCLPVVNGVDYSLPFNIDAVAPHSYKGMVNIEPQWITPILDGRASNDPTNTRFYKPTYFKLPDGRIVHYSWVLFGTYGNIPDILKPTYYFGGYPLPQLLYEQVYAAEKTAKEAPMLAQSKRLNYMEGNLNAYMTNSDKLDKEIRLMSWLRNNWGWMLVGRDQKLGQLDTSLTDVDSVTMLSYQIVSAIAGMPSARLLETSPKGWQSTGSYEDENYKKLLLSIQQEDFIPILNRHYRLLTKSEYGKSYEYNCVFNPIDTPSAKELAEINEINCRTNSAYISAGVVSAEEVRNALRQDETSGFNALSEEMEAEEDLSDLFTEEPVEEINNAEDIWVDNPEGFITMKKQPVPVEKGQSSKEAVKSFLSDKGRTFKDRDGGKETLADLENKIKEASGVLSYGGSKRLIKQNYGSGKLADEVHELSKEALKAEIAYENNKTEETARAYLDTLEKLNAKHNEFTSKRDAEYEAKSKNTEFEIQRETAKAYEVKKDGKTFWIQKRWMREDGTLTPQGEKAFKEALTDQQKQELKDVRKAERERGIPIPAKPDWESDKAYGFDLVVDYPNIERTRRERIFIPKSVIQENGNIPTWIIEKKIKELEKNSQRYGGMIIEDHPFDSTLGFWDWTGDSKPDVDDEKIYTTIKEVDCFSLDGKVFVSCEDESICFNVNDLDFE